MQIDQARAEAGHEAKLAFQAMGQEARKKGTKAIEDTGGSGAPEHVETWYRVPSRYPLLLPWVGNCYMAYLGVCDTGVI